MRHPFRFAFYVLFITSGFATLLFNHADVSVSIFAMLSGIASFFRPDLKVNKILSSKDWIYFVLFIFTLIALAFAGNYFSQFRDLFRTIVHSPILLIPAWVLTVVLTFPIFYKLNAAEQGAAANP